MDFSLRRALLTPVGTGEVSCCGAGRPGFGGILLSTSLCAKSDVMPTSFWRPTTPLLDCSEPWPEGPALPAEGTGSSASDWSQRGPSFPLVSRDDDPGRIVTFSFSSQGW